MQVEAGRVVIYTSQLFDPSGKCVHTTDEAAPDIYLHGHSPVLRAVQLALEGLRAGAHTEVLAAPANAFGDRNERLVQSIARSDWPVQVPAVPGPFAYRVAQSDGPPVSVHGTIVSVDDHAVHIDQNAPLAGVPLTMRLTVLAVRAPTPAELAAGVAIEFPYDVLGQRAFPGDLGDLLERIAPDCMLPPYPWGHVLYAHILPRLAHLSGHVAELGVGLGGTSLFFASAMPERTVFSLDTYEGLPEPDPAHDNPYFTTGLYNGNAPLLDRFRKRIAAHGLKNVRPIPGRFADTAEQIPETLCLVHVDSDLYQSVLDSLEATYDRLEDGGVLIIDDFFHASQGPPRALAAFCNRRGLTPTLHVVFPYSVFLVKGEAGAPRASRCHDGNHYSFNWLRTEPLLRAAVAASVARSWPGTEPHRSASLLLSLLDAPHDRPHDIYDYWRSLSAFWQTCAGGFFHADRIG